MANFKTSNPTALTTQFILTTVELQADGIALRDHIETHLSDYGEPLRWAIVAVHQTTVQVEAVVTMAASNQP